MASSGASAQAEVYHSQCGRMHDRIWVGPDLWATPKADDQFPGWPLTIAQRDNYGRKIAGYLPEVSIKGVKDAVLEVRDQKTGELVYAIRLTGSTVKPWAFAEGTYTVKLGDLDADKWETFKGQTIASKP